MIDETKVVVNNQQTPRVENRANDTQLDTSEPPPLTVTLYTIDNAIIRYMDEKIKPVVTQQGSQVKVPILYASPERWKSAQRDGIIRDSVGKIQLPVLMVRRSSMKKTKINSAVNKYYDRTFYTGWNRRTPYDRFAIKNNIVPSREYYVTTAVPDYYELTYKCIIWTEYMEQMNSIVENISFESDEFWGEPNQYKFRTIISSFQPMTDLPTNSDRVVRTQFDMTVHAYLLPDSALDKGLNRANVVRKRYSPKKIVTVLEVDETLVPYTPKQSDTARQITSGELSYYVLTNNNILWSFGVNAYGQLGIGSNTDTFIPTKIDGTWDSVFAGAYNMMAIDSNGFLWGTGNNSYGQLGLGDTTNRNSMTLINNSGWSLASIATYYGDHTLAIKNNNTLWSTGKNYYGQLGLSTSGSGTDITTFTQIGSGTSWVSASAGYMFSHAIKSDGTLWAWGKNTNGQLGLSDTTDRNTPTQVGAYSDWKKIGGGAEFSVGLRSNGTLWSSGLNYSGQLGVGSNNESLVNTSFTQIGTDTDWVDFDVAGNHVLARKSGGAIYGWGYNGEAQLGIGNTLQQSSSIAIDLNTWSHISAGELDGIGVRENVLYYWGANNNNFTQSDTEPEPRPVKLLYSDIMLY